MKHLIHKILKESDFDWVTDVPEMGEPLPSHGQAWTLDVSGLSEGEKVEIYYGLIVSSDWMFNNHRRTGETSNPWGSIKSYASIFDDDITDGGLTFGRNGSGDIDTWRQYGKEVSPTLKVYKAVSASSIELVGEVD